MSDLHLINSFLEELCFDKDKVILHYSSIIPYILHADPTEKLWKLTIEDILLHPEDLQKTRVNVLWRKKAYIQDFEYKKKAALKHAEFRRIHEIRSAKFLEIKSALHKKLGISLDDKEINILAKNLMFDSKEVEKLLGISLKDIPSTDKPITNINEGYTI